MFWDKFLTLCAEKKVSPTRACLDMGLSNATAAHWKKGATPNPGTVFRAAEYFKVPTEYFAERTEKENLYIKLFNEASEADQDYVLQILLKLHDLREEKK